MDTKLKKPTSNFKDVSGSRFGRWTVVRYLRRDGKTSIYLCRCDCGKERQIGVGNLKNGKSLSCGCYRRETSRVWTNFKHGLSGTPEYSAWRGIIRRCTNPRFKHYRHYGGRGIKICDRWKDSFDYFLLDMGPRPSPRHSIDRINNDGHYEPSNCRWATRREQCRNTRRNHWIEFNGQKRTISGWAEHLNISPKIVHNRIAIGWTIERLIKSSGSPS